MLPLTLDKFHQNKSCIEIMKYAKHPFDELCFTKTRVVLKSGNFTLNGTIGEVSPKQELYWN